MKSKSLFLLLAGFLALFIASSCEKEDPEIDPTGISLDQDSLKVALESTGTLVATLEPEGATGTIEWSSSDPSVAAVNNGIVTALKIGEATVVASVGIYTASCIVTVTPKELDPNDLPVSLKGSNYHIIQIDETSVAFIEDKIDNDFRPDDTEGSKNLYVWESTFLGGTSSGLNFYEQAEGWVSFIVSNVGWSGGGYNVGPDYGPIDMTDLHANPDDYVFHIAMKSAQPASSYLLIFTDGTTEAKVCIGSSAFVDGGLTYQPYTDFARDNEWHAVEIPVSHLNTLGVFFNQAFSDVNIFAFLAGGVQGTTLEMDAVFFYKKAQ